MERRRALSTLDHTILDHIGRLRFVTSTQLAYWCEYSRVHIDRRIVGLEIRGLVRVERASPPFIFALTAAGSALARRPRAAGNRQPSWSVMAHACHVAALEIELNRRDGFRLLDRFALLKQGFNPAHGEHAGVDRNKRSMFLLVDDYGMQSERIAHVWARRHTPHPKHWSDPTGRTWHEVVNSYLVATTDPVQAERHRAFVARQGLVAQVHRMEPLWN